MRPYHTYAKDVLPMSGLYFLKRYTRLLGKIDLGAMEAHLLRLSSKGVPVMDITIHFVVVG